MFRNYFIRQMLLMNPTQQTCPWSGFWSRDSAAKESQRPEAQELFLPST